MSSLKRPSAAGSRPAGAPGKRGCRPPGLPSPGKFPVAPKKINVVQVHSLKVFSKAIIL